MNISLANLSERPKLAMTFGASLAGAAVLLTCMEPWVRGVFPGRLTNAFDFASTLLALFGILYLFGGIQSWRKTRSSGDGFDKAKETAKAGIICIVGAVLLFGAEVEADLNEMPKWLWEVLGKFSMGLLFVGALYVAAGLYARPK